MFGAMGDGVTDDTTAFQNALNQIGTTGNFSVLYLPAGTYRITAPLTISSVRQGISIIGQDPSVTTIKWAGPSGDEMLYLDGVSYSKFSRITWDGSGTALTALDFGWDGLSLYGGSTYVENSDEVFQNLAYGIRGGTLGYEDSEHAILRCKFLTISRAGISVENYNALDYYIWDCTFTNNYVGVTDTLGGGNFHVYGSLFQSSTRADIEIGPTSFFSFRQNFSQNSNAFLIADPIGSASASITLQSNTILDTTVSPIQIANPGTVLMFDNVIRGSNSQSGALVTVADTADNPPVAGGLVVIGNTVSQSNWYSVPNGGEVVDITNNIVARSAITATAPTMPGALTNYNRQIFEVTAGSSAAAIQAAIDEAVLFNGQRPVVHLQGGTNRYSIENTIVIPVGSDVQLIGDGASSTGPTQLFWTGTSSGPVIRLAGPSRAALRDFNVLAGAGITGIKIENTDQPTGHVFMDQLDVQGLTVDGLLVNGLDNASVILHDGYVVSDAVGIQVTGGTKANAGQTVTAKNDMFAGLTASNNLSYNLNSHGRLMSQDVWYEGGPAQLVDLSDSGTFTLHGAHIGAQDPAHGGVQSSLPSFEINNFTGSVSLLAAQLVPRNSVGILGTGTNTQVLALGILGPYDNANFFANSTSPAGQVAMVDSRQATTSAGSVVTPDQFSGISSESSFITSMVAQTRTEQAAVLPVPASGNTDARFYRVSVTSGSIGVDVEPSGPSSSTAPNILGVTSALTSSTSATISWSTDQIADSQVVYGPTTAYGSSSTLNIADVTTHTVALQNLLLGTTYHYAVKSRSLSGYVATSADQTFTTPASSQSANFVSSYTQGALRNNFTGWVGMEFTTGPAVAIVSSLGRIMVSGNTGTHTVKLVRVSDGTDVPGGSVSISMAGGTPGSFKYASLASTIYLSANTSYYLVSGEVSGGDQWYDVGAVTVSNIASMVGAVYATTTSGYVVGAGGSASFVPVDFIYQVSASDNTPPVVSITAPTAGATISGLVNVTANATDNVAVAYVQLKLDGANFGSPVYSSPYTTSWNTTSVSNGTHSISAVAFDPAGNSTTASTISVTVNNGSASGTPLITGFTTGTSRNNSTSLIGMEFTVGSTPITVTSLGRVYYAGNSGQHVVKLVAASTGVDVPGGSVTVSLPYGTAGQFAYEQLASPIQLNTNTSYYLVSQEISGGDQWSDITPVTSTGVATILGPVYNAGSGYVLVNNLAGESYVPVGLLYTTSASSSAPTIAITSPTGGSTITGSAVTISATAAASAGLTITSVQFQVDGTNFGSAASAAPYNATLNTISLTNGTHSLTAIALDSAGNSATSAAVEVLVNNNTPPSVAITSPVPGATVSGSALSLSATATATTGLTITSVQFQLDGVSIGNAVTNSPYATTLNTTLYGNGTHVLTAVATDSSGNKGTSASVSVTFSNSNSPSSFISSQNSSVLRNNFTGFVGMEFTVGNTPVAVYALGRIYVTGNVSPHTVKLVQASTGVDVPGASVSVVGGTAGQYTYVQLASPVTLTPNTAYYLVSQETYSGDQWYDYAPISYSPVASVNGPVYETTTVPYTLVSIPSNSYVPVNFLFLTTSIPTSVSVTTPAAGAVVSGSASTLTASATAGTGLTVKSVQFQIDGTNTGSALTSAPYTTTFDSTKLTNAAHTVTAVVTDSSNATTTSAAVTFTVSNTVTTATVTTPTAGAVVTGTSATLAASVTPGTGLNITSVQFKIDGTNSGTALTSAPYTTTFDSTKLTNASHAVTAVVVDSGGTTTNSPGVTFTVSNTTTSVSVTAPAANATVNGTAVPLTATVTAGTGLTVTNVQYKIDGVASGSALTAAPYSSSFDSTKLTNGAHTVTAVVTDSSNATVTSAGISITVSNTAASITVPAASATVSGTTASLTATVTPGSGLTITSVQFKIDGTNSGPVLTSAPYTTTFDSTKLTNATHTVTAVAVDSGGTTTTSPGVTFTVSNTTTSVSVTAPAANATVNGTAVPLTATVTAGTGLTITNVQYKIDGVVSGSALTAAPYSSSFDSTKLTNGAHIVTAIVADSSNATVTSSSVAITVSNTTAAVTVPAASAIVSGTTATLTASVTPGTGLTITSVQFKIDGVNAGAALTSAPYTTTFDSTKLTNASHTVTVVAVDSGGTTTTSAAVSFTVSNATTSISVTAPTANATVNGTSVSLSATATAATGLTVKSVQFQIDGTNTGALDTVAPYTGTFDSTKLTNGTHIVTAIVTDSSNATVTSSPVSITVSNTTESVTVPAANATVSGTTATLTASVTPGTGLTITSVQFKIDGVNAGTALSTAPYTTTFDSTKLTNASHTVTVVAVDSGGTTTTSAAVSFTVSNATTSISVTAPTANATVNGTSVSLSATATAATGLTVKSVQFQIDGTNTGALDTVAPYTGTFDSTKLTNGTHIVTAIVTDSSNATVTSSPVSITVSNTTESVTVPAANATVSGTTATLTASVTPGTGLTITSVQFKIDGVNAGTALSTAPYTTTFDSTKLTNASHTVTVVAVDSGGTTTTSAAVSFTVSNTTTSISVTSPAASATVNGTSVSLSATATAATGLTVKSVQFQIDGTNTGALDTVAPYTGTFDSTKLTNGTHIVTAIVTDSSNATVTSSPVSITVSNTTESVTVPAANATVSGTAATLTASVTPGTGLTITSVQFKIDGTNVGTALTSAPYTTTFDSTKLTNATHSVTVVVVDSGTTTSTSPAVSFTVSNTTTSVSVTVPTANATVNGTSVALSATATAATGLTVKSVQFQIDGVNSGVAATVAPYTGTFDSTKLTNGTHIVTAIVTDSSNASVTSSPVSITVSNTTESVTVPAANATVSGTTATLTASVTPGTGLTITSVQFKIDGVNVGTALTNAPYTTTFDSTKLTNASHTVTVVAVDSGGTTTTSAAVSFTVSNTTTSISVTSPAASATVNGSSVALSATATAATGLTVKSVQFQIDGTNTGALDTVAPYTGTFDSTKLTNGTHIVTAIVTDSSNATVTSSPVSITVSNTTESVTVPAANATVSGTTATLTASVTAGTGLTITSVQFKIDGVNAGTALSTAPYTTTFDSTKLTNASHTVTVVAVDSGGTTTTSAAVSFTVSNATTSISVTAPTANATVNGTSVSLSATATAATGLTVKSVQFQIDGTNTGALDTVAPYTGTFDSTKLTNGTHIVTAIVTDSSNATVTSSPVSITVSNTTESVTVPAANATVSGTTATLTASVTPGTGLTITSVQFKIDGVNAGTALTSAPYTTTFDSTKLTNASHTVTVTAVDSGGTTTTSAAVSFTVSNATTSISVTAPTANATVNGTSVSLSATATAATGLTVKSVQFQIDGTNTGALDTVAPYTGTFDSTKLTNGTHIVTAIVTDSNNATVTSSPVSITVSNTTESVTVPAANATVSGTTATLTASVTPGTGLTITSVQFKIDGTNVGTALTSAPYTTTFDSTKLTNATHSVTVVVVDSGTTTSTSPAVSFTVSNTTTSVSVTVPTANATVNGTSVALSATATAATGLTVKSVQFQIDGVNSGVAATVAPYTGTFDSTKLTNGTHIVTAIVTDSSNASVTSSPVSITVSNTTESVTVPAANATVSGTTATLTASVTPGTGLTITSVQFKIDGVNVGTALTNAPYTTTFDSTKLTNASHTVTVVAVDSGGTTTTSAAVSFTVSNTTTSISVTSPAASATVNGSSVALSATATAATGLTVKSVQFQIDGTNTGALDTVAPYTGTFDSTKLTNGTHIVTAIVTDSSNATVTSSPVSITVSNTTESVTVPAANATVSGTTATLTASVTAGTGLTITSVQFKIDGVNAGTALTSAPYTTTFDSTKLTNASHTVTVTAVDSGGTTTTSAAVSFTVSNATTSISVTAPTANATVNGTSVSLSATATAATGLTVKSVQFQIDGTNTGALDTVAPYTGTFDSTKLTNGTHIVTAIVTDSSNASVTSSPVSITVSNTTESVTVPAANATVSGTTATLTASVTAGTGLTITSVQFKIDGVNAGTALTSAPYTTTFDSTKLTNASHTVTVTAVDSGGTTTTSAAVSFTVSNTTTSISVTSPAASATVNGSSVALSATATAATGLTVKSVQFQIDGTNTGALDTVAPYTGTFDSTKLTNGTHIVTAIVTDSSNATVTSSPVSITVSNTTESVTVPAANATVSGTTATLTASVTPGTGLTITSVQFKIDGVNAGTALTSAPYTTTFDSTKLTNASHTVTVTAVDSGGTTTTSAAVSFTVSNATTSISVTAPTANATVNGTSVSLSATATAATGLTVKSVQFQIDGTNTGALDTVAPYTGTFDSTKLTNGTHIVTAIVTDSSNASVTSSPVSITVSNTTESVTVPAANATVSGTTATLTASVTAGTGLTITSVQFKIDGVNAGTALTSAPYTTTFDSTKLTNASHTVTVTAVDSGGTTTTSAAVSFTVSNATTSISVTSPAASATVNGTSVSLSATATAATGLTVKSVQFQIDGTNTGALDTVAPYTGTFDSTKLTNGTHIVTAIVTDSNNATVTSSPVSITVSNTTESVTVPAANATVSGTTATLTASVTAGTGLTITSVQFKIDGVNAGTALTSAPYTTTFDSTKLTNASHTVTVTAVDSGGTTTTSAAVSFTVSNATTSISVTAPTANATVSGAAVSLTATATAGTGLTITTVQFKIDGTNTGAALTKSPYTTTFDSTKLTNGTHTVTAVATDSSSATATSATVSFTVSNTATTVSVTAPTASSTVTGAAVTLSATATPGTSLTITSVQFKIDGTSTGSALTSAPYATTFDSTKLTNGTHTVTATALDSGSNSTTSASVSFTVSNTTTPTGTSLLSSFSTGTLRNNYSGYVGMQITVGSSPIGVTALGRVYVSGNSSTHIVKLVQASTGVDVTGGSATITVNSGTAGQFTYAALTSPITLAANTSYYLVSQETAGGDQWYDITPVTGTSVSSIVAPVYYTGYAYVPVGGLPNQSYVPVSLLYTTVSSTPPTVFITSPTSGASESGIVSVTATATAATGLSIASVQFKVDGNAFGSAVTSAPYTQTLNTGTLTNGTHSLTAVATDSTGNVATSSVVSITVSNTPPTVAITAPAASSTVTGSAVTLTATASAAQGLTIASVQFQVDGANLGSALTSAPYTTTFDSTKLTNATHTLTAIATDSNGISTTSAPVSVTSSNVSAAPSGTPLLSGFTPTSLRNNFSGYVGMEITVGSTAMTVTSLGRIYVSGNSTAHIVKLVTASTGVDVPGGSVTITPSTGTAGKFTYASLANPVTLAANTSYYLVSQETAGGDQWYDISGVTSTSVASVTAPVYYTGFAYVPVSGDFNQSYVPVNLLYATVSYAAPTVSITSPVAQATISGSAVAVTASATAASGLNIASVQFKVDGTSFGSLVTSSPYTATLNSTTLTNGTHSLTAVATDSAGNSTTSAAVSVTVSNAGTGGGTALVSGFAVGTLRNNYSNYVGLEFTVGSSPITVTSLGRIYVSGNTGTHTVKLVLASTGADVPGASVTVSLPSGTAGQFAYTALSSSVTLTANTAYYLVSSETAGGDQWYDITGITGTTAATYNGPVYNNGFSFVPVGGLPGQSYVPVSLLYKF